MSTTTYLPLYTRRTRQFLVIGCNIEMDTTHTYKLIVNVVCVDKSFRFILIGN